MPLELCEESCIEKSSALPLGVAGTVRVACDKSGLILVSSSFVLGYATAKLGS